MSDEPDPADIQARAEALLARCADHPAVVSGRMTANELALRLLEYVQFWNMVEHIK